MKKYTIIVESDSPPTVLLGQKIINGCTVVAIKQEDNKLVSAATLAKRYNLSAATVRNRCALINRGTTGKHLYDADEAHQLLTSKQNRRGRKREA
ncbi:MAG: DNA-binding protein [Cardiobacteriales bacterium]|nr:MAG: DNA-binding protein [Cardiobacteriales bacterium]